MNGYGDTPVNQRQCLERHESTSNALRWTIGILVSLFIAFIGLQGAFYSKLLEINGTVEKLNARQEVIMRTLEFQTHPGSLSRGGGKLP